MTVQDIQALCEAHPIYIPVSVAAEFLHVTPAGLRASIDQGRCPFGFSWSLGERSGYKIPTAAFFSWMTKGTVPLSLS
mgnify:CR=1 FL=1